jgi:hypothetical protein
MNKKPSRLLPNGTTTTSTNKYCDEWHKLADAVLELFPGYKLFGFDPGFSFHKNYKERFDLSTDQAQLLLDTVNNKINNLNKADCCNEPFRDPIIR